MIRCIVLRNWKSHSNTELFFEKGTNVLTGVIGAGKTSVAEAMCYALFGTFPAMNARRVSADEVITSQPNQAESATVVLQFAYGGNEYEIERTLNIRGANTAKVFCNGRLLAGPRPSDVNAAVERTLEANYELFSRAVFAEQNQIDYFLRLSPAQCREKFDELLDINRYERVRANAVTVHNLLKRLLADNKKMLDVMRSSFDEKTLEQLGLRIFSKESELKGLMETEAKLHGLLEIAGAELKMLEKCDVELNTLRGKMLQCRARAETLGKGIHAAGERLGGRSKKQLQEENEKNSLDLKNAENSKHEAEKRFEEVLNLMSDIEGAARSAEAKRKELEMLVPQLSAAGAECPVCKVQLTAQRKKEVMEQHRKEMLLLEKKAKELGLEKSKAKKEAEKTRNAISACNEKISALREGRAELKELEATLERIYSDEKEFSSEMKNFAELESSAGRLAADAGRLEECKSRVAELKARGGSIAKEIANCNELLEHAKAEAKRLAGIGLKVREVEMDAKHLEPIVAKLPVFINALVATQNELRESMVGAINDAMADIWEKVYPYADYTSVRVGTGGSSYELQAKNARGEWIRVEGTLSGGERSAAAITLRVAISLVLAQNLGLLVLDEPTHNLDAATVAALSKMLSEHLPQLVDQVFIITHDPHMGATGSASVFSLERDKGLGQATRASRG